MSETRVLTDDSAKAVAGNDNGEGGHMNETIAKIKSDDPMSHSAYVVAENVQRLGTLLPELMTAKKADRDARRGS